MTMSKIIVIHPSTNKVLARFSVADVWCLSSSVFSGVISFFGHDSEIIQEWICDVFASTLLQAIIPRVFVTGDYVIWGVSHWLACVVFVYEYVDYFGGIFGLWTRGDRFWIGVQQLVLYWYWSDTWFCLLAFGSVDRFRDVSVQTAGMGCDIYLYSS